MDKNKHHLLPTPVSQFYGENLAGKKKTLKNHIKVKRLSQ